MPEKVYMLHALWFKPDGGKERYQAYMKEALPLLEEQGGQKLRSVNPVRALEGEFDADLVYFVEYPTWEAYRAFANSAAHHRIAFKKKEAVEKSLLIRCERPS